MKSGDRITRRKRTVTFAGAMLLTLGMGLMIGCQSPPSVAVLIDAAGRAMAQEARLLDDDAARNRLWFDAHRDALKAGYEADLSAKVALDTKWVRDATEAYVAAREILMEREMTLRSQMDARRENLQLAGDALSRASAILQQQDALFAGVPDVRRWIHEQTQQGAGR